MDPYIFSKVMRLLVKYWRSKVLSIDVYLDDGISAAQSFSKCEEHSWLVRSDLFKSGFVSNKCKCQWVPVQVICWLGIWGDFKDHCMLIPLEKTSNFLLTVRSYVMQEHFCKETCLCYRENCLKFLIMGDVCKLMTKAMHHLIECRNGWDVQVVLDSDALTELKFWCERLQSLNCRPIWRKHTLPSWVVYSDASAVGYAAFISMNGRPVSHKTWDAIEIKQVQLGESSCVLNMLCRVLFTSPKGVLLSGTQIIRVLVSLLLLSLVIPRFICISWQ